MSAILIDGGSSINANELAAKFLYSDSGVFYVAFDSSINSTIRSWWLDVLAATDAIIEPEFAIVDATDPKRQLTVKQVESLGSNAGLYSYGYLYSDINGKRIYERDDPSNYSITIAEGAYTHASRFANSKEAGWKSTAFHELGHALGLEHSHDWSDGDGDNVINTDNTVMSYKKVISNDGNPQFKQLDQTALIEIHGKETGQKSTPISGSTLVSDLGTHNLDKTWKPPSLSMEFTAGAYISEPTSGLTKTQLLLIREDGNIESEIKVNLGWEFSENLNWYYPEGYKVGFHDFLMDSPWQVSFAANQSTLAVDVWIVGDTVKEADEWIEVTATPATTPYFLSWPTNPIRLTITEQSIETPKPNSSYTLTPSATTINEGATLTTTVATTNVASGTTLYWSIAGTGVTAADFSSGALTGSGVVGTDGKFSFAHPAANDLTTEGDETLQIKLFADSGLTAQVGLTATVTVKDTSLTPAPTYGVTPLSSSINEGATLTTTVATTNVASGTTLYWSIAGTGVTAADFSSGALTGSGVVGTDGKFSFAHTAANDLTTEGDETLQIKLFADSVRTVQVGSTATVTVKDTSLTPAPTYAVTPSTSSISEGSTLTTTAVTTNVASATTLYYSLSGSGITAADFAAGTLTGSGTVGTDGKFSFSHTIANDLTTEGSETLQIKLFSDAARSIQVGSTASVSISDTSITPAPTYSLTPSASTINEGGTLTTSISTTGVSSGTTLYYGLSGTGITTADFSSGALTGQVTVGTNGTASLSHTLSNDLTTEGAETLQIKLFSDAARTIQVGSTASVSISDTSITPAPTYSLTPSATSINEGGTLTTSIATTNVASGTTLYYALSGTGISVGDFSSDALTGQVTTSTNGAATFSHTLASDLTTEGTETLQIKIFSDSARTTQVGSTASVAIGDTSTALASTFISTSATNVAEGQPVIIHVLADYFPVGAKIYYGFSGVGIDDEDFSSGYLTGEFSIQTKYEHFSLLNTFANDLKTEGLETIEFKLFSDDIRSSQIGSTSYIAIADTSTSLGSADAGRQRLGDIRSAILKENIYANAGNDFNEALLGSSGSDFIVATKSNQFISGIGFDTNTKTYPGVIDIIDAAAADIYNLTFLIDGINGNSPSFDGDKGFTVIKNFKAGSDDLVLSKTRSYVLAGRSIVTNDGKFYSGVGVHIDANNSRSHDSRDELIALLEYTDKSLNRGNLLANTTSFGGRIIFIEVPNNTPTGAPTLSGATKVGQVISIDKTPIQDADNFTGYTPTYNYSFEVSNDNGTTWTKLTTTDATDNNSTYTLTNAEVGKQVRGVVSYLDGYGTNEVVNSTSSESIANVTRTYTLTPSVLTINEGSTLTTSVATTNVPSGTTLYYSFSGTGITAADFSAGSLIGSGAVGTDGKFSISHTIANDLTTEGSESIEIKLFTDSSRTAQVGSEAVLISDTSKTPTPTPQVPISNPGITVRTVSGNNITSETGTTATYSFVLNSLPTDPVTITFAISDGTEGSLSSSTLTFGTNNWNTAQVLTVTGLDDYENDGDIPYVISAVVSSLDPNYGPRRDGTGGVSISNIELTNKDDGLEKDVTLYGDSNTSNYNDVLNGNNGSDRLYGERGRDRLYGGRGGDRLYGGVDDDTLWGEDGVDDLYGNEDDDILYGGNGNDRLTGGEGYDNLIGGNGDDTYVIDDEFDVIDDQGLDSDQDKVIIRGNITAYTLPKGIEGATLDGSVAKNLIGNAGNNELIGNANNNILDGGDGNDYLYSASGDDTVLGGGGDDQIVGGDGKGDDTYDGGDGEDTVIYKSSERNPVEVNLRSGFAKGIEIGNDTLRGIEHVVAGQSDDIITGDSKNNKIDGLAGLDTVIFQGRRSEYSVTRNSEGVLLVQDNSSGRDGIDTLTNIEYFKFADTTYNADEVLGGTKFSEAGQGGGVVAEVPTSSPGTTTATNKGAGTPGAIASSIPGVFREGVTLSAPVVTGDPDGDATNPNYAYQWFKGSTAITNATASTYAVPASGAGTYKVAVTYTDAQGFTAALDSPEQVVSTFNNGNGTPASITGNGAFREGVTLSAPVVTGDPDGDATNPGYAYQWFKGSTAITNATASTYAVPATGAGTYKVAVTYTDAQGFTATVDSPEQVVSTFNNGNGTPASITGNGSFREGVTLTAPVVTGDPDGDATNPNYAYQWFKGSTVINNATASTYAVPASGAGTYKVAVTYTDAQGFTATLDSPEQDILTGVKILDSSIGATKVAGNDGFTDQFALQTNAAPSTPFNISKFNPADDFLQIPKELAGSTAPRTFFGVAKVVVPDRPLTKSEKKLFDKQQKAVSKSVKRIGTTGDRFAYNQLTGQLFVDTNGKKKGFGVGGGLLAVLEDTPAIGIDNFQFL